MKLGLLAAVTPIVFLCTTISAIARADGTPTDGPQAPIVTFHEGTRTAPKDIVSTARTGHVQRCAVVHGDLRCDSAPVALQGKADRAGK